MDKSQNYFEKFKSLSLCVCIPLPKIYRQVKFIS